jgi:uncharacterized surface protein with fasciclin (FAS1) repeats
MATGTSTIIGLILSGAMATAAAAQPPSKSATPAAPTAPAAPAAKPMAPAEPPKKVEAPAMDILSVVAATGDHKTFLAAVKAAGLESTLQGAGPFTVFAPTDEAFKKLPAGTLENLMKPENKARLADVLKFHILRGGMTAAEMMKKKESGKTLQGTGFQIESKDGKVMVGNDPKAMAMVTKADVKASNGVVHVVNLVLMPKDEAAKLPSKPEARKPMPGH